MIGASNTRTITYNAYNKPIQISNNGNRNEFWYDADQQRYLQRKNNNQTTLYIDKVYERTGNLHTLYLDDFAIYTVDYNNPNNTAITYLHQDRLGSIAVMSTAAQQPIAGSSKGYDPFGKPREGDWSDSDGIDNANQTAGDLNGYKQSTRGFTGHEHLNETNLIHMNGRVYDYNLGRFLSVDPVIQFPENSQSSLNPYSYIMNNPMSGIDPSGYMSECPTGVSLCAGIEDAPNNGVNATTQETNNGNRSAPDSSNNQQPDNLRSPERRQDQNDQRNEQREEPIELTRINAIAPAAIGTTQFPGRGFAAGDRLVGSGTGVVAGRALGAGIALLFYSGGLSNSDVCPLTGCILNPAFTADGLSGLRGPTMNEEVGDVSADAPGKPTEKDGFKPPKRPTSTKDGKVKNPNGRGKGWVDADGKVLVPTGPAGSLLGTTGSAHGGSHWDVQNPKTGRHKNIFPGGRER